MILEIFVACLLFVAVTTGLVLMSRHFDFFQAFGMREIMNLRTDAILYVANCLMTAACAIDFAVRLSRMFSQACPEIMDWYYSEIAIHVTTAMLTILGHLITHWVINKQGMVQLYREHWRN